MFVAKDEQNERFVFAIREPRNMSNRFVVAEINKLLARPLTFYLECGNMIAKR
jgi:hypothetical protein